jgi:hypothetical protein
VRAAADYVAPSSSNHLGTLAGDELDQIISSTIAAETLAADHEWRRRWHDVIASASSFKAERHHG